MALYYGKNKVCPIITVGASPTGTIDITENGTVDVANYATANVQVPNGTEEKTITENGTYTPKSPNIGFSSVTVNVGEGSSYYIPRELNAGSFQIPVSIETYSLPQDATDIGNYALSYAFYDCDSLTSVDLSSLKSVSGSSALYNTFYNCGSITSVDLSNLESATGANALNGTFYDCDSITSVDLSNLKSAEGTNCFTNTFYGCDSLSSVNLSNLESATGTSAFSATFYGNHALTSIDLSSLKAATSTNAFYNAFVGCTSLASVDLGSLETIGAINNSNAFYYAFQNCTSLASVNLGSLTSAYGSNAMYGIFSGCTSLRSVDLSSLKAINGGSALSSTFSGCTNLSSVNFDGLESITGDQAIRTIFYNCSNLHSVSFPQLTNIKTTTAFNYAFQSSSLTEVHFRFDMEDAISALTGYPTFGGSSSMSLLFDLSRAQLVFDITGADSSTIYVDGEEVTSPCYVSSTEDHIYVIEGSNGVITTGTVTGLSDNEVRSITVDLSSYNTVSVDAGVSDLQNNFEFILSGTTLTPQVSDTTYYINLSQDTPNATIKYRVYSDNIAPYIDTLSYEGSSISQTITLEEVAKSTFTRPNMTSAVGIGGTSFGCQAEEVTDTTYAAWKAMDGNTSTYWNSVSLNEGTVSPTNYAEYIIYNPNFFVLSTITLTATSSTYKPYNIEIYTSIDGETWDLNTTKTNTSSSVTLSLNTSFPYKYVKVRANQQYYYYYTVRLTEITMAGSEWAVSETYPLTINTVPEDAKILTPNGEGSKTMELPYMGKVTFKVFKDGYIPVDYTASITNQAKTVTVTLEEDTSEPNTTWYAWTNGSNTVYTQTLTPLADADWTFSSPNTIANVISAVSSSTITSNSVEYTRNSSNDVKANLISEYMTFSPSSSDPTTNKVSITLADSDVYSMTVDWGDNNVEDVVGVGGTLEHTYSSSGDYQVKITSELGKLPLLRAGSTNIKSADSCWLPLYSGYLGDFTSLSTSDSTVFYNSGKLVHVCSNLLSKNNLTALPNLFYYCTNLLNPIDIDYSILSNSYGMYRTYVSCNKLVQEVPDLSNITSFGAYALQEAFANNHALTGSVNLSGLSSISVSRNYIFQAAFYSTGITSVNLSNLKAVNGNGTSVFNAAFGSCASLTSVDLSKLETISDSSCFESAFKSCTSLNSIDLSKLKTANGSNAFYSAFYGCTSLTSMSFPSLKTISNSNIFACAFQSCTSLKDLSFPALTTSSFGSYSSQFNGMLNGVTGCTVHFPADIKHTIESWSDVKAGFGGTNTIIKYDINGCAITFSTTPSTGNTYYLDGVESEANTYGVKGDASSYVINNDTYGIYMDSVEIPDADSMTITNDLTTTTFNSITLASDQEDCTVTFTIDGISFTPTSTSGSNYILKLCTTEDKTITYSMKKKGYATETGTLTYTGSDITKSITMTPKGSSIEVNLTPGSTSYGWQAATVTNPTSWSMYESTNKGVQSSYAVMKVTFSGYETLTCYINSYAESSCDYTMISNLDVSSYPTSQSSNCYANTMSKQYDPTIFNTTNWTTVTYSDLDGEEHFFYVVFRKDGSVDTANDRGYFIIDENQE